MNNSPSTKIMTNKLLDAIETGADQLALDVESEQLIEGEFLTFRLTLQPKPNNPHNISRRVRKLRQTFKHVANELDQAITIIHQTQGNTHFLSLTLQIDSDFKIIKKSDNISLFKEKLYEYFVSELKTRRPKRKREDLPDPSQSPKAYVNEYPRLTKQFKTNVSPDLAERVDEFSKATGKTKREIVEAALEKFLDEHPLE